MKKIINIIAVAILLIAPLVLSAQNPPHPNGGNNPAGGNNPVGGGAPIDGGLSVMLVMCAAYCMRKTKQLNELK